MNPYRHQKTLRLCGSFYRHYFNDDNPRTLLLGINPGRFGAGLTGICFTDPIKLENDCGIANDLEKKPELSADFIYRMIHAYGGPDPFYRRFLISAVSPLGFTKKGLNMNYYDDPGLQKAVTPFIVDCIRKQVDFGIRTDVCFCIGRGANQKFLESLNTRYGFFRRIVPLPHPRWIMQYRRKHLSQYIDQYVRTLNQTQ